MRISGGWARGIRLKAAPSTRPTSERVRQAIFSSLAERVVEARVLDLFCGSGAYGLEAVSRGAASAVLVDRDQRAVSTAKANVRTADMAEETAVHRREALAYLRDRAATDGPFDLVFVDPPYADAHALPAVLEALRPAVQPDGLAVLETGSAGLSLQPPDGWVVEDDRRYGDTQVLVFRRQDNAGCRDRADGATRPVTEER